jgi:hypothetical protein
MLWPAARLIVRWVCPESNRQVEIKYERGSEGTAAAPSALPLI